MIAAATGTHRVFLRDAQAGQGLAGIDHLRPGAGDGVGVDTGLAGHRREQLQEIQRAALGGQQGAGIAFDFAEQLIGDDPVAVGDMPGDVSAGVEAGNAFVKPGRAAKYACFPGNHRGLDPALVGNQAGGQVADADILGQRGVNIAGNLGGKRVVEGDGRHGIRVTVE